MLGPHRCAVPNWSVVRASVVIRLHLTTGNGCQLERNDDEVVGILQVLSWICTRATDRYAAVRFATGGWSPPQGSPLRRSGRPRRRRRPAPVGDPPPVFACTLFRDLRRKLFMGNAYHRKTRFTCSRQMPVICLRFSAETVESALFRDRFTRHLAHFYTVAGGMTVPFHR